MKRNKCFHSIIFGTIHLIQICIKLYVNRSSWLKLFQENKKKPVKYETNTCDEYNWVKEWWVMLKQNTNKRNEPETTLNFFCNVSGQIRGVKGFHLYLKFNWLLHQKFAAFAIHVFFFLVFSAPFHFCFSRIFSDLHKKKENVIEKMRYSFSVLCINK